MPTFSGEFEVAARKRHRITDIARQRRIWPSARLQLLFRIQRQLNHALEQLIGR
jgi:hypothetical protein